MIDRLAHTAEEGVALAVDRTDVRSEHGIQRERGKEQEHTDLEFCVSLKVGRYRASYTVCKDLFFLAM